MLHYKDRAYCSDTCRCATKHCQRYITDEVRKGAREMELPIAWASFKDGCEKFMEKPLEEWETNGKTTENL